MDTFKPGDVILGKYKVTGTLGKGGMGFVLAARNLSTSERVALKFLLPALRDDAEVSARFDQEALTAIRIENEHVARVLDAVTLDDGPDRSRAHTGVQRCDERRPVGEGENARDGHLQGHERDRHRNRRSAHRMRARSRPRLRPTVHGDRSRGGCGEGSGQRRVRCRRLRLHDHHVDGAADGPPHREGVHRVERDRHAPCAVVKGG
jgi:hypothetical protein